MEDAAGFYAVTEYQAQDMSRNTVGSWAREADTEQIKEELIHCNCEHFFDKTWLSCNTLAFLFESWTMQASNHYMLTLITSKRRGS